MSEFNNDIDNREIHDEAQQAETRDYQTGVPGHSMAIAALITGICGFFCCGSSIAAIILAVMAKKQGNNESIRTAGFILGIVSLALSVVGVIIYVAIFAVAIGSNPSTDVTIDAFGIPY